MCEGGTEWRKKTKLPDILMNANLTAAHSRIAACLMLDAQENLVQRHDHLNLVGLGLTVDELTQVFHPKERGLPRISIANLQHLRYLDLTGNALLELPECVCQMSELEWLGLNFNQLRELPEEIGQLTRLQRLYLRGNSLKALPSSIGTLDEMLELDLAGNQINIIPASMRWLERIEHIELEEKAIDPSLRAVWKEGGWKALLHYLNQLAEAEEEEEEDLQMQFIGKVILVGSQEHGKTCLQRALRNERFIAGHKSTDGMSRERLFLKLDGKRITDDERQKQTGPQPEIIDLTLWDMGGQESYQHTHQMFFTPSAVYLIVTLPREGGGVQKLDEWIELVKRRTDGEASVIVVSTWCHKRPADKALTLTELQAKHGEMIRHLISVDSEDGTRIQELRELIAQVVQEPRAKCGHVWLPNWAAVLNELSREPNAFLRWAAVREVCQRHHIVEEAEMRQIIRTGHYIGTLLWREDIPAGEDVVILNPDWLSRAVARLLDDDETQKAHGLVDIHKLDRVWRGPGRDKTPGYEPSTYPALIELMEINELAYRPKVPGNKTGKESLLLITQMVETKPKADVDEAWETISPHGASETVRVVAFRKLGDIGYGSVPDIIYLLIFRLRDFSLGRKDYAKAIHWQRGLLVKDEYDSAGRIELEGDKLRVTVRHHLGEGLMHSIIHRIGVGDDEHWNGRGLEKVEFVPCGAICPANKPNAGLISMTACAKAKKAQNHAVHCEVCDEYVNIAALLQQRAVESEDFAQLRAWLEPLLQELQSGQGKMFKQLIEQSEEAQRQAKMLRQQLQMHEDRILDAFTSEWKDGPRLFSLIPIPAKGINPKNLYQVKYRVTVWCEASRRPVPFFGVRKKDKPDEFQGSEVITLTNDWVQKARKTLVFGSWALFAAATGGAAGIGGLVSAAGGFIKPEEATAIAAELAKQQKAIKEVLGSIPDEEKHLLRQKSADLEKVGGGTGYPMLGLKAFGPPVEDDLAVLRYLRSEFAKNDPEWAGLKPVQHEKYGRIWAHPDAKKVFG